MENKLDQKRSFPIPEIMLQNFLIMRTHLKVKQCQNAQITMGESQDCAPQDCPLTMCPRKIAKFVWDFSKKSSVLVVKDIP